ncbi:hypothetical protein T06_4605 [Trichinella sp. T6]|nr:hypothetical protein T06_4605 [Trichinella sp. T6]
MHRLTIQTKVVLSKKVTRQESFHKKDKSRST